MLTAYINKIFLNNVWSYGQKCHWHSACNLSNLMLNNSINFLGIFWYHFNATFTEVVKVRCKTLVTIHHGPWTPVPSENINEFRNYFEYLLSGRSLKLANNFPHWPDLEFQARILKYEFENFYSSQRLLGKITACHLTPWVLGSILRQGTRVWDIM